MTPKRRWLVSVVVAAAVLLIVGRSLAGVYSDYLWYEALGAGALWRVRMSAVVALRVGSAIIAGLFAFANLYAVRQSVVSLVFPRRLGNLEIGEEVPNRLLMSVVVILAIILGALLAMPSDHWQTFALARFHKPFNETDPYFSQDLGFFVYWLPLENALWMFIFIATIVVSIVVILLYALTPSLRWQRGSLYASAYVRRHFTVLVGVLLLLLAWSFRLDMYGLLIDGSGADGAFSWADYRVAVPGDLLLSLLTLGAALIVLWAGFVGQFRLAAISVISAVGLALIVRLLAPTIATHSGTDDERATREQPHLATRATYTRRAYDVDGITRADASVLFPSVGAALPSLAVWDPIALVRAMDSGRSTSDSLFLGWRVVSGRLAADVLESAPPGTPTHTPWIASRALASDADDRGEPIRLGMSGVLGEETSIAAPLVYPGATTVLVVADTLNRVSGTPLESFAARLATAWSTQNFQLLNEKLPEPRPTLLSHRDVRDRVDMFVPFFAQGRTVSPVLLGDSLYWAVDLYSTSDSYPLSRHYRMLNGDRAFLHHAGVAIVQASTGDVMVVADTLPDPITDSWKAQLPSLFTTWSAVPAGIRAQLAPPIDGLFAQAVALGRYGLRGEMDVQRHPAIPDGADTTLADDYLPMLLPDGRSLGMAIPLVDDGDRLRGMLIGRSGPQGQTSHWYALDGIGPRWVDAIDRLRSIDSANVLTRDGPLVHGQLRPIPLRSGAAFAQTTYRWRGQAPPVVSRVLALSGDTLRSVAPPLGPSVAPSGGLPPGGDLHAAVTGLYTQMREALRRGDFPAFGRAFDALGRVLESTRR